MTTENLSPLAPGPWTVHPEGYVFDVNRYPVAIGVGLSNANLIGAAPDLLAALKAVVTDTAGGSWHSLTGENAKAALDAIAKAEGRA